MLGTGIMCGAWPEILSLILLVVDTLISLMFFFFFCLLTVQKLSTERFHGLESQRKRILDTDIELKDTR